MLLILRASVGNYPPTLNQANLLANKGLRVGIIDLYADGVNHTNLNPNVMRWQPHKQWNSKAESLPPIPTRWMNWLNFHKTCRQILHHFRPNVVISYDMHGCIHSKPKPNRFHTVFHYHELVEAEKKMGIGPRISCQWVMHYSRRADLVIFSDSYRASIFEREARLRTKTEIVMNCPTTIPSVPISNLSHTLSELGLSHKQVVCYLGSIGFNQGLVEVAKSMYLWPKDAIFILIGPYHQKIKKKIEVESRLANVGNRVLFLGSKPHEEALSLAAGSDIGLSVIQPNTKNLLYSAGAVNKRFEYMALGLPQVTNAGIGVADIIEKNDCGVCVDPKSPEQIGKAILNLLKNPEKRHAMSLNARSSHLSEFNYENQFSVVADWIESLCHNTIWNS